MRSLSERANIGWLARFFFVLARLRRNNGLKLSRAMQCMYEETRKDVYAAVMHLLMSSLRVNCMHMLE